jgi:hypothetical protein
MKLITKIALCTTLAAFAACAEKKAAASNSSTPSTEHASAPKTEPMPRTEVPPASTTPTSTPQVPKPDPAPPPISNEASASVLVGDLITSLNGVTDASSAKAAAERYQPRIAELSAAKTGMTDQGFDFAPLRTAIDDAALRVDADADAKAALAPLLDALRNVVP